jgi:uncharacterized protein
VDYLKQFVIPFRGLSIDTHSFDFVIDKKFFEAIEYAELEDGQIKVSLEMVNQERMMILNFHLDGYVEVICDRCLEPFHYQISGHERLIVKHGASYEELSDEVIVIPEGAYEIDISKILYEFIVLMLPMRRIHPEDENGQTGCNPEMIEKLQVNQSNHEPDPRWDALKKLKRD